VLGTLLIQAFGDKEIAISGAAGLRTLHTGKSATIADSIFTTYVVPFEIVSILLLAALVGAVVIARRD
jgi:NADH-quinone oxidoreductase subunit J